jgi:hypothetical protein
MFHFRETHPMVFRNHNAGKLEALAIHMLAPKACSATQVGAKNQAQDHRDTAPELTSTSRSQPASVEDAHGDGRTHPCTAGGVNKTSVRKQGRVGRNAKGDASQENGVVRDLRTSGAAKKHRTLWI